MFYNDVNTVKIAFIDPGFGKQSFATFGDSHWSSVIHHGLCSLSACVKEAGFNDVALIDIRRLKDWEEFKKELREKSPDVLCVTMRSCDFVMVNKILLLAKEFNSKIKTIVGGVHPTVMPQEVMTLPNIDHIIAGEGEVSLVELLKALDKKEQPQKFITGKVPDINKLPFDDRALYDYKIVLDQVSYPGIFKPPMITMHGSRGCPYNCSYCAPHARTMFGNVRFRTPKNVIDELITLREKYNFKSIKFYDYSFTLNKKWVLEFCDLYDKEGFKAEIIGQSRADLICKYPELLPRLKNIGLKLMLVGFESGSQKVLDSLNKGTTIEQNFKAAQLIKDNGIMLGASFMLGSPYEWKEDVDATVDMAKKMNPHFVSASFFTPVPGSTLYDYCKKNDLSLVKDYEELITYAPGRKRIKGVDYKYLQQAVDEIMGARFGGKISGKIIQTVYIKTKNMLKLRHFLVRLYSMWVRSRLYSYLSGSSR